MHITFAWTQPGPTQGYAPHVWLLTASCCGKTHKESLYVDTQVGREKCEREALAWLGLGCKISRAEHAKRVALFQKEVNQPQTTPKARARVRELLGIR